MGKCSGSGDALVEKAVRKSRQQQRALDAFAQRQDPWNDPAFLACRNAVLKAQRDVIAARAETIPAIRKKLLVLVEWMGDDVPPHVRGMARSCLKDVSRLG